MQTLINAGRSTLDHAYPPSMIEYHDMHRAYLTQLAKYRARSGTLNKTERGTLRQLLATLEEIITQRNAAQPSATSTTTMRNQ